MEKIRIFIAKWQNAILVGLFFFLFLGQCSINRTIDKMKKDEIKITASYDSLKNVVQNYKNITKEDLQIEGLKAEKRMIQSIDRKILDVNRQSEIDKEIEALSKNK